MTPASSAHVDAHTQGRRLTPMLAVMAGLSISTVYMIQPVLGLVAQAFHLSPIELAKVPAAMQIAYALGLFLVVPLADALELRALMRTMLLGLCLSLLGLCLAPNLMGLLCASICIGLTATVTQVFVPIAAKWTEPQTRAKAVGTVVSGILSGVLLSRVVSGLLGERLGWRAGYLVDAGLLACAWAWVPRWLNDPMPPPPGAPHWRCAWKLQPHDLQEGVLWRAIGVQGLLFASMMALWNTVAGHMTRHGAERGAALTGMLGLVGLCGVIAAPWMGRLIDRIGQRPVLLAALLLYGMGFLFLAWCSPGWWQMAFGILLVDLGLHAAHIANQSSVQLVGARAGGHRLNSLFMGGVFICGALGSWLGPHLYGVVAWPGVCMLGLSCTLLALLVFVAARARQMC